MLIRGGRVIDPGRHLDVVADVRVDGDLVTAIGNDLPERDGEQVFDASGKIVAPGLVDVHTHLRDPGFPEKETLETGAASALHGGFTTICCMPNTNPPLDTPDAVTAIVERAASLPVHLFPIGTITLGRKGEELADLEGMAGAGAIGFSDDGDSTRSSQMMREALMWSKSSGKPIMVHAEDWTLAPAGVMNEGAVSKELRLPGIPGAAEEITTGRDIELARLTGGWLHVLHVSTARALQLVRRGKHDGIHVTAEVMPHHLLLTDEWVAGRRRFVGEEAMVEGPCPDPNAKVNPPLRTEADAWELLAGLNDGAFDIIATDHAPHAEGDKPQDLRRAASGMTGLELAIPLLLRLVESDRLDLSRLIDRLSTAPARLFNLPGGRLRPGSPADMVVIDPNHEWTVGRDTIASRSLNTPLLGMTVRGAAVATVVGGEVRYLAEF